MVGLPCDRETGEIRDVLAQGQLAVHAEPGERLGMEIVS
jgi:hypothetical protein